MTLAGYPVGFESQDAIVTAGPETISLTGTAAISTAQARTGLASLRCNPASGVAGSASANGSALGWVHFGLYVATLPSIPRVIAGTLTSNVMNLQLNANGTLTVALFGSAFGTSVVALQTGRWYWIGWLNKANTTGPMLQIDAVDQGISGTTGTDTSDTNIGCTGTEASAIDIYIDDYMVDDTGFLNPSRVGYAVPISDNAVGTGWTNDAGAATALWDAVNNQPPVGIADTAVSTGLHQIRNAASNLNAYAANLTTYAALGVTANDKVLSVHVFVDTGSPSATSAKSGSITLSNPTLAKASFGTFYAGSVAGTFGSGWQRHPSVVITSPVVTVASSPVVTITQDTSSTRVSMVCYIAVVVAWTPGALNPIGEPGTFGTRGLRNISQGSNRASSY